MHRALLVADMPYGSYHVSTEESVRNAIRLVKDGGADAVKVEGGERRIELISRLVEAEIPVMGHIGLTPQSIHALGGFHVQGKSTEASRAHPARRACGGSGGRVLRGSGIDAARTGARITEELRIPTIGIGAGPDCDGQVLVFHDLVGPELWPQAEIRAVLCGCFGRDLAGGREFCEDVRWGNFPRMRSPSTRPLQSREKLPLRTRR